MKIYHYGEKIEYPLPAVALGNFDGMHLGHLRVIETAKEKGESFGALLFDRHSAPNIKVITTLEEKIEILKELGADFAYVVSFNDDFRNMSCAEFCDFLFSIGVKTVSVGYDYRCGKGATADSTELTKELGLRGIETIVSEPVLVDNKAVKSSKIRELIADGDIESANNLMTRPYKISGAVSDGLKNGRKLGFPTANIEVGYEILLPKDGVYCCECQIEGKRYPVVLNIGKNPTFDAKKRTVEAHIIDFDDDIYGKRLDIDFYKRIRGEVKFDSMEELSHQINLDRQFVISWRENRE